MSVWPICRRAATSSSISPSSSTPAGSRGGPAGPTNRCDAAIGRGRAGAIARCPAICARRCRGLALAAAPGQGQLDRRQHAAVFLGAGHLAVVRSLDGWRHLPRRPRYPAPGVGGRPDADRKRADPEDRARARIADVLPASPVGVCPVADRKRRACGPGRGAARRRADVGGLDQPARGPAVRRRRPRVPRTRMAIDAGRRLAGGGRDARRFPRRHLPANARARRPPCSGSCHPGICRRHISGTQAAAGCSLVLGPGYFAARIPG